MGEMRNAYKILAGIPESILKLGRPAVDVGYKIDFKELVCLDVRLDAYGSDRFQWRALVNTVMNLRI
jgi:hypothetical protein